MMDNVRNDLASKQFKRIYLLTGEESFLIKMFKKQFIATICGDKNALNLEWYKDKETLPEGKNLVTSISAYPMFATHKLIIIDECMGKDEIFVDFIPKIPDTAIVLVVSADVDKRSKLYKAIKKDGYVCECKPYNQQQLTAWVSRYMQYLGIRVDLPATIPYLVQYVGTDMNTLVCEMEKLASNVEVVTIDAINTYCYPCLENKVFEMIQNAINGRKDIASKQYDELIALKEAPMKILSLITRQLKITLAANETTTKSDAEIAKALGVPPFVVSNNRGCRLPFERLLTLLEKSVEYDYQIKSGHIKDQLAVERLLVEISM